MTDERVRQLVEALPGEMVARLAKGPVPQGPEGDDDPDGDCRICAVFDEYVWGAPPSRIEGDVTKGTDRVVYSPKQRRNAAVVFALFDWHQGRDLEKMAGFRLGEGPVVWRRCLTIYRAAGWDGPA